MIWQFRLSISHYYERLLSVIVCASLLITVPASRASDISVLINEIAWMGDASSANHEWIELTNTTPDTISLNDWTLRADDNSPNIALSGEIFGYGYYLLERTSDDTVPGIPANKIFTGALGNENEKLGLYDSTGARIDYVDQWYGGNNDTKETMQRAFDNSWCTLAGTPGAKNTCPDLPPVVIDPPQPPAEEPPTDESPVIDPPVVEPPASPLAPAIRITEVQPNGPSTSGDYVEVTCISCDNGVKLSDMIISGKFIDSADMLFTDQRVLAYFGKVDMTSRWLEKGGQDYFETKLSSTGISGTQGEVELALGNQSIDAVCWNPGGIEDPDDADQVLLHDRNLWTGACLDSVRSNATISFAFDGTDWLIDHNTPGIQNTFANNPPQALISLQSNSLVQGTGSLSFNATGIDSSDPDSDPLKYFWDFGNGITSEKPDPTSLTFGEGAFTVELTVTDPFGAISKATQAIQVLPKPVSSGGAVVYISETPKVTFDISDSIFINELLVNPEGVDQESEFIELRNEDSRIVDLTGWKIRSGNTYTIHDQIEAGGYLVLPAFMTRIALKNSPATITLIDPNGNSVREISYTSVPEGKSYSRKSDGTFEWVAPTPAEANIFFDIERYSSGTVIRTVDGDTLEVEFAGGETQKVRLIGIDTPETAHPLKEVQLFGKQASELLKQLAADKQIHLEFDTEKYDAYNRLLAYVYIGDSMINLEMLRSGLAGLYDKYPFSKLEEFRGAAAPLKLTSTEEGKTESVEEVTEEINHDYSGALQIVSVLPNPRGKDTGQEQFTIHNLTETDIDLAGWRLVLGTKKHAFPKVVIPAHKEAIFSNTDFKFSLRNSNLSMQIMAPDGSIIDSMEWSGTIKESQLITHEKSQKQAILAVTPSPVSVPVVSTVTVPKSDPLLIPKTFQNVWIFDVSKLSDGLLGLDDGEGCFYIHLDPKKHSVFLLSLLAQERQKMEVQTECFGSTCILTYYRPYV